MLLLVKFPVVAVTGPEKSEQWHSLLIRGFIYVEDCTNQEIKFFLAV